MINLDASYSFTSSLPDISDFEEQQEQPSEAVVGLDQLNGSINQLRSEANVSPQCYSENSSSDDEFVPPDTPQHQVISGKYLKLEVLLSIFDQSSIVLSSHSSISHLEGMKYIGLGKRIYHIICNDTLPKDVAGVTAQQIEEYRIELMHREKPTSAFCHLYSSDVVVTDPPPNLSITYTTPEPATLFVKTQQILIQMLSECFTNRILGKNHELIANVALNNSISIKIENEENLLPFFKLSSRSFTGCSQHKFNNIRFLNDETIGVMPKNLEIHIELTKGNVPKHLQEVAATKLTLWLESYKHIPVTDPPRTDLVGVTFKGYWRKGEVVSCSIPEVGSLEFRVKEMMDQGQSIEYAIPSNETPKFCLPKLLQPTTETLTYFA